MLGQLEVLAASHRLLACHKDRAVQMIGAYRKKTRGVPAAPKVEALQILTRLTTGVPVQTAIAMRGLLVPVQQPEVEVVGNVSVLR